MLLVAGFWNLFVWTPSSTLCTCVNYLLCLATFFHLLFLNLKGHGGARWTNVQNAQRFLVDVNFSLISVCMARLNNGFGLLSWLMVGWFVWLLVNLCGCLVGVLGWLVCLLGWSAWLVLNWFSDARKRHFKIVISQNFPCGVGRGRPPPPPSPSRALSLRRHCSSFLCTLWHPQLYQILYFIFHPPKTEYEIETKETMQREQKVIVLRTMAYCNVLCEDKRLLNWFSDARKRHFKVVISQNFPCGAGRGQPHPHPPPEPCHCVDIAPPFFHPLYTL